MNYLKCAVCIVILWLIFASLPRHFSWTTPRSTRTSETLKPEADDSDAVIQIESQPEDQGFIEKWSQSHPQNQESQEEDPLSAGHADYFHSDQPDYFGKGQQKPAIEDHWGMDKTKSIGH
jgi:hypothetical protein